MNRRCLFFIPVILFLVWLIAGVAARALVVEQNLPHADLIVVLAGSTTYKERVSAAAQLIKAGRAQRVVLTDDHQKGGWSTQEQRNLPFVEMAFAELQQQGVDREKIDTISPFRAGTFGEASAVRDYVANRKFSSLLIVTSAYHSRRALWTFKQVFNHSGVEIGLEPVPTGRQTPSPWTWWLHFKGWQLVPGEYVKIIYYWFRY